MIYVGIDPGASGGIARLSNWLTPCAWKMPDTEKDIAQLFAELAPATLLDSCPGMLCCIELVHAMPKQGVTSVFSFGRNYGFLRGMLIAYGIPFEEVTPLKWQKTLGCQSHGDKNITKSRAQQLFPGLKITHATADALLIAEYTRRTYGKIAS